MIDMPLIGRTLDPEASFPTSVYPPKRNADVLPVRVTNPLVSFEIGRQRIALPIAARMSAERDAARDSALFHRDPPGPALSGNFLIDG